MTPLEHDHPQGWRVLGFGKHPEKLPQSRSASGTRDYVPATSHSPMTKAATIS